MTPSNHFSLLVKPSSADCNLRCTYCFYLRKSRLYPETYQHRMSDEALERLISSYMATDQPQYVFGWQGGEPTMMGVEFFRRVTELQQKYGRRGAVVANGLQTNATLINNEFASHLAQYNFLAGISLDGPAELHNAFRKTSKGQGSHEAVLRGLDCLRTHGVEFNVLTVVNSANVTHATELYQYLCRLGIRYHQYIPCVEFDSHGEPLFHTITGQQWGDFLCEIFDRWYATDTRRISIRLFDAILNLMVYGNYALCHMGGNCRQYFVVEFNGDVYPCDFFVNPSNKLGSIFHNTWEELIQSQLYRQFGALKAKWNLQCSTCKYLRYCSGDCLKHRFYGGEKPEQLSWLCKGWKQFYEHALPRMELLALTYMKENGRKIARLTRPLPGRNEPCYCGSGKKYKKCHGPSEK